MAQNDDEELIPLYGEVTHQTEKAWLFKSYRHDNAEMWLPKSRCEWSEDEIMYVPLWLLDAKEKEME